MACGWTDSAVDIDRLEYFRPSACPSARGVLIDSAMNVLNERANETMTFSGKVRQTMCDLMVRQSFKQLRDIFQYTKTLNFYVFILNSLSQCL